MPLAGILKNEATKIIINTLNFFNIFQGRKHKKTFLKTL